MRKHSDGGRYRDEDVSPEISDVKIILSSAGEAIYLSGRTEGHHPPRSAGPHPRLQSLDLLGRRRVSLGSGKLVDQRARHDRCITVDADPKIAAGRLPGPTGEPGQVGGLALSAPGDMRVGQVV